MAPAGVGSHSYTAQRLQVSPCGNQSKRRVWMSGLIGIAVLLGLMFFLELPVGLAMGVVGLGGLWYLLTPEAAFSTVATEIWATFSSYGLSVIPLFVWMGQICFYSGVNEKLYSTAYTWMGRTRGGLAMSTIMACAGFAAICGF